MTECTEVISDRCIAALQRIQAMSFSDDEDSRGCKRNRSNSLDSDSEEEDETLPLCKFAPGFGWMSPYSTNIFFPPIGPHRCYDIWLPRWKHHCISEPITYPEFPNMLDEDIFWLMYLIHKRQECFGLELTEDEHGLHRWSIILLSKQAVR